jgi:hypothetical protein
MALFIFMPNTDHKSHRRRNHVNCSTFRSHLTMESEKTLCPMENSDSCLPNQISGAQQNDDCDSTGNPRQNERPKLNAIKSANLALGSVGKR